MIWLKFANEHENIYVMLKDSSKIIFGVLHDDKVVEIKDMDEYINIVNALKGTQYEGNESYITNLYMSRVS